MSEIRACENFGPRSDNLIPRSSARVCIVCHDGSPPIAVNDARMSSGRPDIFNNPSIVGRNADGTTPPNTCNAF